MTRGGGRRIFGGRRNSSGVKTLPQKFTALLASKGRFAFEARSNTNDGTNVLTFVDLIDPTRTFVVSGVLAKPTADPFMAGAPLTCAFTGSQSGSCNKAASTFAFASDGTGMEIRSIFTPTSDAGTSIILTTRTSLTGFTSYRGSGATAMYVGNGGAAVASPGTTVATLNTPCVVHDRFSSSVSPNITHHSRGQTDTTTTTQLTAPDAGAPQQTLTLGVDTTNFANMRWFGSYGFAALTTAERALLDAYTTAVTGVTSP